MFERLFLHSAVESILPLVNQEQGLRHQDKLADVHVPPQLFFGKLAPKNIPQLFVLDLQAAAIFDDLAQVLAAFAIVLFGEVFDDGKNQGIEVLIDYKFVFVQVLQGESQVFFRNYAEVFLQDLPEQPAVVLLDYCPTQIVNFSWRDFPGLHVIARIIKVVFRQHPQIGGPGHNLPRQPE